MKNGLVLSGGGAKGAYQVGVIKALAELDCQIDAISGASIGALNGAVIAQSKDLYDAAGKLEKLWLEVSKVSPLKLDKVNTKSIYFSLLKGAGAVVTPELMIISSFLQKLGIFEAEEDGLFSDSAVSDMIHGIITPEGFDNSLPLYVSVYQSSGRITDIVQFIFSCVNVKNNRDSKFIKIQDLPSTERINLLLASAAIPVILAARNIDGKKYYDGGMGGAFRSQGNTPIDPLITDCYSRIFVSHLSDGSMWTRHEYPSASIIEIRPQEQRIKRSNMPLGDLLGFSPENIESWIRQGYDDTIYSVGRIKSSVAMQDKLLYSQDRLKESIANNRAENELDETMKLLDR